MGPESRRERAIGAVVRLRGERHDRHTAIERLHEPVAALRRAGHFREDDVDGCALHRGERLVGRRDDGHERTAVREHGREQLTRFEIVVDDHHVDLDEQLQDVQRACHARSTVQTQNQRAPRR
jgi:hypothetical protein